MKFKVWQAVVIVVVLAFIGAKYLAAYGPSVHFPVKGVDSGYQYESKGFPSAYSGIYEPSGTMPYATDFRHEDTLRRNHWLSFIILAAAGAAAFRTLQKKEIPG